MNKKSKIGIVFEDDDKVRVIQMTTKSISSLIQSASIKDEKNEIKRFLGRQNLHKLSI